MGRVDTLRTALTARRSHGVTAKGLLQARMCVTLAFIDLFGIASGFAAVSLLRLHGGLHDGGAAVQIVILAPVFLIVALFVGAYSPRLIHDCWMSIGRALYAMSTAAATTLLVAFFLKIGFNWSRLTFICCVTMSGFLVMVLRYAFGRNASFLLGGEPYEVLRLYDGPVEGIPESEVGPIGLLTHDDFDPTSLSPDAYDRFAKTIEHADRVVVHCPIERRHYWARALKGADVQGEVVTPEFAELNPLGCGFHAGMPTLIVSRAALGLQDRMLKRASDIAIAGGALLLLSPLLLICAVIIRLQDGGPVFFSQTRVGRSNRQFRILKFRSMYVHSADEAGKRSASRSDDRITAFGRIIRATSIDELPQLFNVLKGDMSIVGPRPHALGSTADNLLFWDIDDTYWHRHAMKPGLTGLAQVRGYRGATLSKEDLLNRLQSDLEYMRTWSIWRDIAIMIRTFNVLFHKNAY
jgi:exopolysaccharide biosynthesis polyprenyl glycosylphosphotransferase